MNRRATKIEGQAGITVLTVRDKHMKQNYEYISGGIHSITTADNSVKIFALYSCMMGR